MNREFLISASQNGDYLVREEACAALAVVEGPDITGILQSVATSDSHEAVRDAASQALLEREIRGRTPAEKLALLRRRLEGAERHDALWILQTILAQCGDEGRAFLDTLASEDSRLGERSFAYLLFSESKLH